MRIKLKQTHQLQAVRLFAHAAHESSFHVRKILATGANLFTKAGTEVTLRMAVKRRRRCIRLTKAALEGFII